MLKNIASKFIFQATNDFPAGAAARRIVRVRGESKQHHHSAPEEEARLQKEFLRQQQLIESLLSTRCHLLKQHEDCLSLCMQMTQMSVSVSNTPPSGRGKKRREEDEEPALRAPIALPTDGAFDPSLADDVLEEPSVVYRSCSADSVDEGEQMDGSLLALQVRAMHM